MSNEFNFFRDYQWIVGGWVLRSVVWLSLISGCAWLFRRQGAALRHMVWAAGLVGILTLPLLQLVAPSWRLPWEQLKEVSVSGNRTEAFPTSTTVAVADNSPAISETLPMSIAFLPNSVNESDNVGSQEAIVASPASLTIFDWPEWRHVDSSLFVGVWLIGFIAMISPVVIGLMSVWKLERTARPMPHALQIELQSLAESMGISRQISGVLSSHRSMPMTWGFIRPTLLLPADAVDWNTERRRVVFCHELAHIQRWDCLTQALGQIARAVQWFNPLTWLALNRLRLEQERACDDVVLNNGAVAEDYATELLSITTKRIDSTWDTAVALAMSRSSRLETRLHAILDSSRKRTPLSRSFRAVLFATATATAILVAAFDQSSALGEPPTEKSATTTTPEKQPSTKALAIANGDFEGELNEHGLPTGWQSVPWPATRDHIKYSVEASGHTGKRSVSIEIKPEHPEQKVAYHWSAEISGVESGSAYELSAWVRTEKVSTSPVVLIQSFQNNGNLLSHHTSEEKVVLNGTKEWTKITVPFRIPKNSAQVRVLAVLVGPENKGGKAWFDDFTVTTTKEAVPENLINLPATPKSLDEIQKRIEQASAKPVSTQALQAAAIKGMLDSLKDPHSVLLTSEQMRELHTVISNNMVGIGVMLSKDQNQPTLTVVRVLPNSPALKAGIKAREQLLEIDGQAVTDVAAAAKAIRGQAGTSVKLKLRRTDGTDAELSIVRAAITLAFPPVTGLWQNAQGESQYWLDAKTKIGYIQITQFTGDTAQQLEKTLLALKEQGLKGLVLDLRGNPGGMLLECTRVAGLFLKNGETVVQTRDRVSGEQTFRTDREPIFPDLPMVVLIDGTTASAAEILAGALRDHQRAFLLGERTFGKGSVQSIFPVGADGDALKLTSAFLFLPKGQPLQKADDVAIWGVDPDDGGYIALTEEQRQLLHQKRLQGVTSSAQPLTLDAIKQDFADPLLAAGWQAMAAKLADGQFSKPGRSVAELHKQLAQRETLRKKRDELRQQLELLDREIGLGAGQ